MLKKVKGGLLSDVLQECEEAEMTAEDPAEVSRWVECAVYVCLACTHLLKTSSYIKASGKLQ